jgi:hypothetical protein
MQFRLHNFAKYHGLFKHLRRCIDAIRDEWD